MTMTIRDRFLNEQMVNGEPVPNEQVAKREPVPNEQVKGDKS